MDNLQIYKFKGFCSLFILLHLSKVTLNHPFFLKTIITLSFSSIPLSLVLGSFHHFFTQTHHSLASFKMSWSINLLEKAMATHSSTLAWKIPRMEEAGGPQPMGSLQIWHGWATSLSLFTFMHWRRKWQPTPVFLPGGSQGRGSLVGCCLWGRTELDTTEVTWQQQQQIHQSVLLVVLYTTCDSLPKYLS